MTEVADQSLSSFPMPRNCPFDPPRRYRELREQAPVSRVTLPSGRAAWLLTRHEDVRTVLTDPRFSSDRAHPNFPMLIAGRLVTNVTPSMVGMDPPEHARARGEVVGEFTVKRMRALRPRLQEIVDERIDALLAGPRPADLVRALSLPVPSLVICELLGVPYADHDFFQLRSSRLLSHSVTAEQRQSALDELRSYLDELITVKERDPGEDLLGRQIRRQRENGAGDHAALVGLALLLLIAGHETTANMISLGTVALLENPEQLAAIRDDPERTPGAVEELLRYFSIADIAVARTAKADAEIGGVRIPSGDGVLALVNAANHDPAAFDDPDSLDVGRATRHHVAFGFGVHQCLGQHLARAELQVVFDTLFRRVPGLRLAATVDELRFKHDGTAYGLYELPVTW
jgi:cytochrome P450